MMKKATWKKLFTRSKSKTRDKNKMEVVCNLCVGMPLADINTLCDRHRNLRTHSGNSISLQNSARDAAVETQKPPGILKSASPTSVAKPAVEPSAENNAPRQEAPEKTETFLSAEESTRSKKDDVEVVVVETQQDGAVANEEFMTEEMDSPNLSENSRTENTVPIVIEPQEPSKEEKVLEADDSNAEPAVSTSLPADAQNLKYEPTPGCSNQDDQVSPQKAFSYKEHIATRKAQANLVWFGSENGPEKSSEETPDEANGERLSQAAPKEQIAETMNEPTNDLSEPSVDANHNQYATHTWQDQQASSAPNPILAEPTPLSTLLPNVFLNAPLGPQTGQTSSVNREPSEGSNDHQEREDEEYGDDDLNLDEGFVEDEEAISDAEESADAQATSTNQPGSKDVTTLSPENQQSFDGSAPRMVFGTLTSEFSAQPLFFSPNFGIQGMGRISDSNDQENAIGEDSQYQNFSILGMLKDYLPPSAFESQEGRVTEIAESTESKRQIEEGSDLHGQSPPSLDDEDESDRNGRTHMAAEEEKQLKKE